MKVDLLDVSVQVGGITANGGNVTNWFWVISGIKISYPLKWNEGEPNITDDNEFCLNLSNDEENRYWFNDVDYWANAQNFVCQQHKLISVCLHDDLRTQ